MAGINCESNDDTSPTLRCALRQVNCVPAGHCLLVLLAKLLLHLPGWLLMQTDGLCAAPSLNYHIMQQIKTERISDRILSQDGQRAKDCDRWVMGLHSLALVSGPIVHIVSCTAESKAFIKSSYCFIIAQCAVHSQGLLGRHSQSFVIGWVSSSVRDLAEFPY